MRVHRARWRSIQSAASVITSGFSEITCVRPSTTRVTTPVSSSTFRCFEMAGFETPKPAVASPTVAGPAARRSTIPRRMGCESALNGSFTIRLTVALRRATPSPDGAGGLGRVQADGGLDEGHERLLVDLIALVEVDRAPSVAFEARVEQPGWVVQRGALEERELHHALVGLPGADDAVVGPDRDPRIRGLPPLPLLDHVGVGLLDQRAHPRERVASPVAQLLDTCVDLLRGILVRHVIDDSPGSLGAAGCSPRPRASPSRGGRCAPRA